jgi:hypothetical protein
MVIPINLATNKHNNKIFSWNIMYFSPSSNETLQIHISWLFVVWKVKLTKIFIYCEIKKK